MFVETKASRDAERARPKIRQIIGRHKRLGLTRDDISVSRILSMLDATTPRGNEAYRESYFAAARRLMAEELDRAFPEAT
jgi:hypothetical protein